MSGMLLLAGGCLKGSRVGIACYDMDHNILVLNGKVMEKNVLSIEIIMMNKMGY